MNQRLFKISKEMKQKLIWVTKKNIQSSLMLLLFKKFGVKKSSDFKDDDKEKRVL